MDDDFEGEEMSSSIHDKKTHTAVELLLICIHITKLVVYFPETNDKTERFFLIL